MTAPTTAKAKAGKGKHKAAAQTATAASTTVPIATVTPAVVAAIPLTNLTGLAPAALAEMVDVYTATGSGSALAAAVLAKAKDSASALHGYFEWDDTVAAAAHRLSQAEGLVRRVHVTLLPPGAVDSVKVRAFVSTNGLHNAALTEGDTDIANAPSGSYRMLADLTGTPAYEATILQDIDSDLRRLKHKYRAHQALFATAVQNLAGATS